MKYLNILEAPIQISGLSVAAGNTFHRLPSEVIGRLNSAANYHAVDTSGGCVRFTTNSKQVEVRVTLLRTGTMNHIPLSGWSGTDIYFDGMFSFTARPADRSAREYTGVANRPSVLDDGMHKVECYLPLYNGITKMEIGIDDDAEIAAPPAYKNKAVCFYGSSITQGGCASKPGNNYSAMLSRWLDFEQRNLGFSAGGKGEDLVARYISLLDLSAFVMDYDHNAPTAEHLKETHERFFKIIRDAQPELPVIFISKPGYDNNPEASEIRRDIIRATYENALKNGDKNVRFIDGRTLFGDYSIRNDRRACTMDGTHPNDLGFYRMARTVYPVLKEVIENGKADNK